MTTLLEQPAPVATAPARHEDEQRFVLHDVSWADYRAIGQLFADRPALRLIGNADFLTAVAAVRAWVRSLINKTS